METEQSPGGDGDRAHVLTLVKLTERAEQMQSGWSKTGDPRGSSKEIALGRNIPEEGSKLRGLLPSGHTGAACLLVTKV